MTDRGVIALRFADDGPEPADLAQVFGSADPDGARRRARHAADLFHAGLVPRLLLSGGGMSQGEPATEAGLMLQVVLDLGVPRDAILVEDRSLTTFENVSRSVALLDEPGLLAATGTILLVSSPWHMRRVSLIARAGFPVHVGPRCCPHHESCTADSWSTSLGCRDVVVGEAELLISFIEASILPDPSL